MTRMHVRGLAVRHNLRSEITNQGIGPRGQEIVERTRQHKRPAAEKTRLAESTAVVWHVGLPVVFRG